MLSSILFESATLVGVPKVSEEMLAKYGYNSEHRIAMERAVELNDIFYESFYKMEELDFQHAYATMEGADESVLEGIMSSVSERAKGAIEKIKTFLEDLWKKVQAFFHNVKRFLDGIFMNAQDFVKKYESEPSMDARVWPWVSMYTVENLLVVVLMLLRTQRHSVLSLLVNYRISMAPVVTIKLRRLLTRVRTLQRMLHVRELMKTVRR